MVSKQAELRRKSLIENKSQYKDSYAMQTALQKRDFTIWWNDEGEILGYTQEPEQLDDSIKKYNNAIFTAPQAEIIVNNGSHNYCIKTDPNVDTVHYIELKKVESTFVTHEKNDLSLIEKNIKRADIIVSLKDKTFTVKCSKTVQNKYKDKNLKTITANGSRLLKFYFTSEDDPSFLLHNTNFSLSDLIESGSVERTLPSDLSQCSIYTIKIFDKYVRT